MKFRLLNMAMALLLTISCVKSATHPVKRISEGGVETFELRGEVMWKGGIPVVYPIPTTAYHSACGKRHAYRILRLKRTRLWHNRLLDVAVWLEPVWEEMLPEDISNLRIHEGLRAGDAVKIFEENCEFVPRMLVIPVGSRIEVYNKDRKDHWFMIDGAHRKREQYVQYYGNTPSVFTFQTPGVHHLSQGVPVELVADKVDMWHMVSGFHRWMEAWVVVTDKIWFGKVDENGVFELNGIPRGVYRVNTWHPILGLNSSIVRVPDDTRGLVAVDYKEDPYKFRDIASTVVTTYGEVREENNVWKEIEGW